MPVVTLHFGTARPNLHHFITEIESLTSGLNFPALDGDGWEAWGEYMGANGNDLETAHIQVDVRDSDSEPLARALLKSKIANLLVPMQMPGQLGTVMVITDAHDWSQTRFVIRADGSVPLATQNQTCPACGFSQRVARVALDGPTGDIANGSKWPCTECRVWFFEQEPVRVDHPVSGNPA